MSTRVVINLPDDVYHRAEHLAQLINRSDQLQSLRTKRF